MSTTQTRSVFDELRPPLEAAAALVEADRCLECGGPYAPAPCVVACPAAVDVPAFVSALAGGDVASAAHTIFAENILGGTCARVCPVEVLCEGACLLEHDGQPPVQIARLQRFATDWAFEHGLRPRVPAPPSGRRVAVIGAGPAGLACGGELAASGHEVVVFDERRLPGGLARSAIAPYRIRSEPLEDETRLLEELGVELRVGERIGSAAELRALETRFDAIVLAVGMGEDADVRYPGDELQGVWQSLPFIAALKTGRPPAVGTDVVVIGGGNTAFDVAREAALLGAERVTIVYRRTERELPAYPHEVEEARADGVELRFLAAPLRFLGDGWLDAVECVEMRLGAPDESGRPSPEPVTGSEFTIPADTAVLAIGQRPRLELLDWVDGLEFTHGRLSVDPATGRTGNPKYFAAGDAVSGGATVVEAVRDAKRVARALEVAR